MADVRLPDGTIITNVPEGITQSELAARVSAPQQETLADPVAEALTSVGRFAEGTQLGLQQARAGAEQLGESIIGGVRGLFVDEPPSERPAELKSEIAMRDIRLKELGAIGQAGGIIGEALPSTLLPGGPAGGLARRVAGGVAADVAASVADPVREGETRLEKLGTAAAFSAGLRAPVAALSPVAKRIFNAKAGKFADSDIKELIDTADAEQISIFFDDVSRGSFARQASAAAEVFGRLGTAPGRIRQNQEALTAANRWLERVSNDGDDFAEIVQTGLGRKLDIFKREASKKYDRVAREIGDEAVVVDTRLFDNASDVGIAAETAKGTRANQEVVNFLQKFKDAPRGDFNAMIEFRSDMGKELSGFLSGDVPLAKSSIDSIIRATKALDEDMAKFASSHGAKDSWRAANAFYQNTVLQFKKGKLKALLNEKSAANFDEQAAWKYLVQNTTNPKRARLMFQSLDSKGREAVRFGLIKEALEKSTAAGEPFSPAKFGGYLETRQDVINQFFKGQAKDEINGLINVMRHIKQAGSVTAAPATGTRAILPLLGVGTIIEPTTAVAATGTALTLKGLFQTKSGRNLLLSANTATPGSQAFDKIVENITKVVSRVSN